MAKQLKLIVVKHIGHEDKPALQYEHFANALMDDKHYLKYLEKSGYHFTPELAEYASTLLKNANGQEHTWSTAAVMKAVAGLAADYNAEHCTEGDITYLANMYYADFYPDILKDSESCIKAAVKMSHDPDGYDGMVFCRWVSDVIGNGIKIEWKQFV